jgi:hypothetical protein
MKTSPYFKNLINQIRKGEVIFWVGSGFSKTSGFILGSELVERIKENLNDSEISFFENKNSLDDVSEEFTLLFNRKKLEDILVKEYGKSPKTLQYQKQIKKIPQITKIITTNYDTCFEQVYGDKLCKIVLDTDLVKCSQTTKVNLYKIHGDIENPQGIIISKSNYANFYKKGSESLVWNEIRSLITKSSILFIGYSFEDANVKLIFDDILERLGNNHHDFFLISPKLPSHRQDHLKEKYSIKYIDMTVQKAIPKLLRTIEKNLIDDIKSGYIKPPFLNWVLDERKINADFSCNPDGTINIKSINGDSKIEGHISYKVSKENFDHIVDIQNFLEEKKFGEVTLSSSKGALKWSTKIGPSRLFNSKFAEKVEIKIKSKPNKEIKADLGLKDSALSLECIAGEHYFSQHAFQIDLHYIGFDISITGNKNEFKTFSFHTHPKNVIQGYKIFNFLNEWINGRHLQIFFDSSEQPFDISIDDCELEEKNIDFLKWNFNYFSHLFKIQQKFNIFFDISKPLSNEEYEKIIAVSKLLAGEKIKVDPVKCTVKPIDYDIFLKTLDDPSNVFTITMPELSYRIFGKEISLKNCSIEISDMTYLNKDEIKSQIQDKRECFDLIIGSKTDSVFLSYNFKSELLSS